MPHKLPAGLIVSPPLPGLEVKGGSGTPITCRRLLLKRLRLALPRERLQSHLSKTDLRSHPWNLPPWCAGPSKSFPLLLLPKPGHHLGESAFFSLLVQSVCKFCALCLEDLSGTYPVVASHPSGGHLNDWQGLEGSSGVFPFQFALRAFIQPCTLAGVLSTAPDSVT